MTDEQVEAFVELYDLWNNGTELALPIFYGDITLDSGKDYPFLGFLDVAEC